jgi:hypothetical protein
MTTKFTDDFTSSGGKFVTYVGSDDIVAGEKPSPPELLDFAHQQRLAILGAKNAVNIKRRECISHGPSLT